MPKINREVLARVKEALDQYEVEVTASGLAPTSKKTYILHSSQFVRWLDDDFEPGATLKRWQR